MSSARPAGPAWRCADRCLPTAFPWCRWCAIRPNGQASGLAGHSPARRPARPARPCVRPGMAPSHIVSCAHARHAPAIIAAAPADGHAGAAGQHAQVHPLAGCAWQRRAGRRSRLAAVRPIRRDAAPDDDLRRAGRGQRAAPGSPAAPAAGAAAAGRRAVPGAANPPVRRDALHPAALDVRWDGPASLVIAGPASRCATPISSAPWPRRPGCGKPFIVPFPAAPLLLAARLTRHVAALPTIEPAEIRRLVEDKAFDIAPMRGFWASSRCR